MITFFTMVFVDNFGFWFSRESVFLSFVIDIISNIVALSIFLILFGGARAF